MTERHEGRRRPERPLPYRYKSARLVEPAEARTYGIAAEAPVLVSLYVGAALCTACGEAYGPLAYPSGRTVTAQHLHPSEGGIYHCTGRDPADLGGMATDTGWLLELVTAGPTYDARGLGRAARVVVRGVRGICRPCSEDGEGAVRELRWRRRRDLAAPAPTALRRRRPPGRLPARR